MAQKIAQPPKQEREIVAGAGEDGVGCVAFARGERGRINDLITGDVEPRLYGVNVEVVPVDGGAVLAV